MCVIFFFQAEDGIRDYKVTGVQTCALPISDGLLQPKEEASVARDRQREAARLAAEAAARSLAERTHAQNEREQVAAELQSLAGEIARAEQGLQQSNETITNAEERAEALAKHPQLQAAVEAQWADVTLPQTV